MSSARQGAPPGVQTEEWLDFKRRWQTSPSVRRLGDALAAKLESAPEGASIDELMRVAAEILEGLASEYPRCIHEQHDEPGYRAQWQHWTAAKLQSLKRQGRAQYDRDRKVWFGGGDLHRRQREDFLHHPADRGPEFEEAADSALQQLLNVLDALDDIEDQLDAAYQEERASGDGGADGPTQSVADGPTPTWESSGRSMGKSVDSSSTPTGQPTTQFNFIPGSRRGPCCPVLVVAVGAEDDVEHRILQAIEHVRSPPCVGVTKAAIFWAAGWDSRAWRVHRWALRGIRCWIKVVGDGRGQLPT
jgi:hypothetical protein